MTKDKDAVSEVLVSLERYVWAYAEWLKHSTKETSTALEETRTDFVETIFSLEEKAEP
jgi:hypothetical protein